ncbi:hypothetical protein FXF51_01765 [Nonomuraea sp. PA05]|uniref:hypothetical protein n=1 Tax=Nonomuraea sp. PA05 TaxID=2604466 RepID=UPI0011D3CDC3|nr:hypothetical protein [Nonomuraea sp. PA05]TYB71189.1 hypothetical protein FXF51_01765 [Nonomuraea sp. PA05]
MADAPRKLTPEQARDLYPFLEAGRRGLAAAKWRVGMDADDLLAPVVLAVIAEMNRRVQPGKQIAAAGAGFVFVPVELLDALSDPEPCYFDHDGGCQAHGPTFTYPRCPHAHARELLATTREEPEDHA